MKKIFSLVVICFLALLLSTVAYCKYETKVTVLNGIVTVKQSKTGQEVSVGPRQTTTSGEDTLTPPQIIPPEDILPEMAELSKEERQEEKVKRREASVVDLKEYEMVVKEFVEAISQKNTNKVFSCVADNFRYDGGSGVVYDAALFRRYLEDFYRATNNLKPVLTTIKQIGLGTAQCVLKTIMYFGEVELRCERTTTITFSDGNRISFIKGELWPFPGFGSTITIAKNDYWNGVKVEKAFTTSIETASTGTILSSLTRITIKANQSYSFDSEALFNNTTSGDCYLNGANMDTIGSARVTLQPVGNDLDLVSDAANYSITSANTSVLGANEVYVLKTKASRYVKFKIISVTGGVSVTIDYIKNETPNQTTLKQ